MNAPCNNFPGKLEPPPTGTHRSYLQPHTSTKPSLPPDFTGSHMSQTNIFHTSGMKQSDKQLKSLKDYSGFATDGCGSEDQSTAATSSPETEISLHTFPHTHKANCEQYSSHNFTTPPTTYRKQDKSGENTTTQSSDISTFAQKPSKTSFPTASLRPTASQNDTEGRVGLGSSFIYVLQPDDISSQRG